jgi:SPP1 family predicted phage head-tail adaptor
MNLNGKPFNPGELSTKITLQKQTVSQQAGGFDVPNYITIADAWARWTNVHGSEVWASQAVQAKAPATVLIRYRADVDLTCVLLLDGKVYEIISIDDIQNRHEYQEIKCVYVRSG